MKKAKIPLLMAPIIIIILLFLAFSQQSCKVRSCKVKYDGAIITCDATDCPSGYKCQLQMRNKNTEQPWTDQSEPLDSSAGKEYRCLCRKEP